MSRARQCLTVLAHDDDDDEKTQQHCIFEEFLNDAMQCNGEKQKQKRKKTASQCTSEHKYT